MEKHKNTFQNLLHIDGNNYKGPMSPLLFMQGMAKELDFRLDGMCRWHNPQSESGYDILIAVQRYNNNSKYMMFIDCGIGGIPVGLGFKSDDDSTLTPIYKRECISSRQEYHRADCEITNPDDNPIPILMSKELQAIFKEADEGGYLTPKSIDNE